MNDSDEEPMKPLIGQKKYGTVGDSGQKQDLSREYGFKLSKEAITNMMESGDDQHLKQHQGLEGVAKLLQTNLTGGIADGGENRKLAYGENKYDEPEHATLIGLFLEAFQDVALIILTVAAFISLTAGLVEKFVIDPHADHWIEGVAIICTVIAVSVVGAVNNYSKDLQFRKLNQSTKDRPIRVMRNDVETQISIFDLVVGDIVLLHTGAKLPADGLFIPGLEVLLVDESSLTGESEERTKGTKDPFLWAECNVVRGSGKMLVTAVGMETKWGRTKALLEVEDDPTPLQEKLEDMVVVIGKIGTACAVLVFLVLVGYYINDFAINPKTLMPCSNDPNRIIESNGSIVNCSAYEPAIEPGYVLVPTPYDPATLINLLSAFIVAVTIIVVAVPEGLPLAVTISLAYSMKLMARDQNLVRHLSACETMGGATTICSDKTGTLTENKMKVVQGWMGGSEFRIDKAKFDTQVLTIAVDACCLNNEDGALEIVPGLPIKFLGSSTECALLVFAEKLLDGESNYKAIQKANIPYRKWGFTSARKRMSTAIKRGSSSRLFVKGASEIVLKLCTKIVGPGGEVQELQKPLRKQLKGRITELASQGLRTICLAYKDIDSAELQDPELEAPESDLICIGLVGIEDPLRPEVPDAILTCQQAGIVVRMVTGDNVLTAKKIARDCGIYPNDDFIVMEGPEFAKKTDDELNDILPRLRVLARSSPADKHRLVTRLRELGEVVAVTGDGTNDAPALMKADVGLAMGIAGTEVAKQAADIIILDDNFASIVKSVMWGRCVYDNIRKFLQFQLTVNVVALVVAFVGAVTDYGTPLTAVQLLWVNLIMDSLAALALGTEKPTPDLLRRRPYGRESKLLTWTMIRNIIGQAVLQLGILFSILYAVDSKGNHLMFPGVLSGKELESIGEPSVHYTIVFNTFVFLQVFNEINSRKVNQDKNVFTGLFTNPSFCGVMVVTVVIQALIVEFGGEAIRTVGLDWESWLYCIGLAYLSLPWGFLLRFIPVPLELWEEEIVGPNSKYERIL